MNFVFFSPHFPPNFYYFCLALKRAGVNVLGIGDCEFGDLRPELRAALGWYYKVSDLHNYGELTKACGFFASRFGPIDGLDSLTEYWLETESRLRSDFNIPGIKTDTIAQVRRKSAMKQVFAGAGVPVAEGRLVNTAQEARDFAAKVGFPVVIKPDDGVGAAHTYKISSHAEIDGFFACKPERDFIMEQYIDGDIVTFDGLADGDGDIVFCTSHFCYPPPMEALLKDSDIYYYSFRDIPPDLEAHGRKLVREFNVRKRFFHFEFFRRKDGSLVACEVNMRPPGGMTVDMFNFACDIDMYDVWARVMAGKKVNLEYSRKYYCCYISRKYPRSYRRSREEILNILGSAIAYHGQLPQVFSRGMGNYGYIVRSETQDKIFDAINLIQS